MIEIIKNLILDFQEQPLESRVPRDLALTPVPGKAAVCIGVRRCGKSTFLFQLMQKLLVAGVPRENILYINFFDDRLHFLTAERLALVSEAYYSLFPEKKNTDTVHCFFDEIQAVPGWEAFVDRLMRTEKCTMYLTGSSAHMLSREIATHMRGRSLSWELFPFSFHEFLAGKGLAAVGALTTKRRLLLEKAFAEYWVTGGFPEVLGVEPRLRVKMHQEYFHAVLFRDLVERHDAAHPRAVSDLAHWLVNNVASLYSINRLTGYLKSLGHKVPKATVSDYLAWFEDAYFLFSVRLFDASVTRSLANPKKVYCIDHAMVVSMASGTSVNAGHLLENWVFITLRRQYRDIYYYRTKGGREVDFIVPKQDGSRLLVQVCESLADPATRKRELTALGEAMAEQAQSTAMLVTRTESGHLDLPAGKVELVPAWRFLA